MGLVWLNLYLVVPIAIASEKWTLPIKCDMNLIVLCLLLALICD